MCQTFWFAILATLCRFSKGKDLVPADIVTWDKPNGALIRTEVVIQGGVLRVPGNGKFSGTSVQYDNGSLFKLDLNEPFDINNGGKPPRFEAMNDNGMKIGTTAQDGWMFADYDEYYVYGGAFSDPDAAGTAAISNVLYDPVEGQQARLDSPVNNFQPLTPDRGSFNIKIRAGAGANAPSESLGFYFGGVRRSDTTPVFISEEASDLNISNSLLIVDTTEQSYSTWKIPEPQNGVRARSEATMVWLPVGAKGMLVIIGGMLEPTGLMNLGTAWDDDTHEQGNNFTKEISLYDVASERWFTQNLRPGSSEPGPLARACAVVATDRRDESRVHHDIYLYGGNDGNLTTSTSSEVWVLSIPSFEFIKLPEAASNYKREGHICVKPYDDLMMVIAGTQQGGLALADSRLVDTFNLSTLQWSGKYDPEAHADYTPSDMIVKARPEDLFPDDIDPELRNLLNATYDVRKIHNYGPYNSTLIPTPTPPNGNGTDVPSTEKKWVVPVAATLGTVGGLAVLGLLFFFCFWRPRKQKQRAAHRYSNVTTATAHRSWIDRWRGSITAAESVPPKDLNSETDGAVSLRPAMSETNQPGELEGRGYNGYNRWSTSTHRPPVVGGVGPHEVGGAENSIHEVHGNSPASYIYGGQSPDLRQHHMHPPSVVSGGHPRSEQGDSVSTPTYRAQGGGASVPASSVHASASGRKSPRPGPFSSISETAAFGAASDEKKDTEEPSNTNRHTVSPMMSPSSPDHRPHHRRHNSSMSSGLSSGLSPLPSPGEREDDSREYKTY